MCFRKRILAFIIDIFILALLYMIIGIIPMYDDLILISEDLNKYFYIVFGMALLIITLAFIGKDAINGQSIGKRITKIKVVDDKGYIANIFKCIIRNITIYIWPIEALLVLLDKKKLGDRLAGTNVVECD